MDMWVDQNVVETLRRENLVLCFAHINRTDEELLDLFGHLDGIHRFDNSWTVAHIIHHSGLFASISEAKKAGWTQPIEPGWQKCWPPHVIRQGFDWLAGAAIVGKKQKRRAIWVLK